MPRRVRLMLVDSRAFGLVLLDADLFGVQGLSESPFAREGA